MKQLTQPGIEKHLMDFGVDAESASHTQINQLSGGMKVKVVLAAAMWQNPHILILDEPTNYLDREGLGALVLAIKDYKGGVLIISHNKEFCDGVAQEKWIMNKGYLRIEGESVDTTKEDEEGGNKVIEDIVDASGNKIEQNAVDNSSDKDKKKKLKEREQGHRGHRGRLREQDRAERCGQQQRQGQEEEVEGEAGGEEGGVRAWQLLKAGSAAAEESIPESGG